MLEDVFSRHGYAPVHLRVPRGPDAFLLSSRNGRSRLVAAKIAAAALYATALFAVGVPLALSR